MLFPCGPASQLLNQAVLENTTWQAMLWQSLRAGTYHHLPELWFLWQPASPASAGFAPATHHMGKTAFRQERKMSGMLQLIAPCHFWVPRSETDSTLSLNSALLAEGGTWHYTLMPFGVSCAQRCAKGTWHFDLMPFGILCSEVRKGHLARVFECLLVWHFAVSLNMGGGTFSEMPPRFLT